MLFQKLTELFPPTLMRCERKIANLRTEILYPGYGRNLNERVGIDRIFYPVRNIQ